MQPFFIFFIGRFKGIIHAWKGFKTAAKSEHSIILQLTIALLMQLMGWYFNISPTAWILQTLAIGMVIATEMLNTALEKIADFIHPEYHKKIKIIKDIGAGAVFVTAITSIIIGLIIYIPLL